MKRLLTVCVLCLGLVLICPIDARAIPQDYKIVQSAKYGEKLQILYQGKAVYEITTKYADKIIADKDMFGEQTTVDLIYDHLAERGSLKKQPKPFDDVTGDGLPDVVFIEKPLSVGPNTSSRPMAIRLVSFDKGKAIESEPYFGDIGEMIHFDDFNHDNVLELVNTDHERYFLYSRDNIPISGWVLLYDKSYKEYYPANFMVNDKDG